MCPSISRMLALLVVFMKTFSISLGKLSKEGSFPYFIHISKFCSGCHENFLFQEMTICPTKEASVTLLEESYPPFPLYLTM